MLDYWSLILLLVSCWLLQISFTYRQHKDYQMVLNNIKSRQSGFLGVGVAKAKFKLGRGVIVLLVTDAKDTILEYHEMAGFTVFARFKEKKEFTGTTTAAALSMIHNTRKIQAFQQAMTLITNEKQKLEDQ